MEVSAPKRIVVLASGRGSNFEALAKAIQSKEIPNATLVALVSNKTNAEAVERARKLNVPVVVVPSKDYRHDGKFDRDAYEKTLIEQLKKQNPDWVCLAGYMLILGKQVIQTFEGQLLNIHPSLLPKFKGLKPQQQALDAGEKKTGCTVHFVTQELDSGKSIEQREIEIFPDDTEESLSMRLLPLEHECYVSALKKLLSS